MEGSHGQNETFEKDTWFEKPEKIVLEQLKTIQYKKQLQILDLCCGVGRNSIPLAKALRGSGSRITCVDSHGKAIDKLRANAKKHGVEELILPFCQNVHSYPIKGKAYDFIVSWSCLEHLKKYSDFNEMLPRIMNGTRQEGINCFLINTEITEYDTQENMERKALIDLNFKQDKLIETLQKCYKNWEILKLESENYINNLVRYGRNIIFKSRPLIFCARRNA